MSRLTYSIVVKETRLSETESIARIASQCGFTVENIIPEIGAIFGSAEEADINQLRHIEGIEDVQRSGGVQLPELGPSIPQ